MENYDNPTEESLPGTDNVAVSDDTSAVSEVANATPDASAPVEGMTLDELNAHLGKRFPDKETALKSIKDTFKYVGAKKGAESQDIAAIQRKFSEDLFFVKRPDLEPHRELAEALAAKHGVDVTQAVELPSFKSYVEKASGYDTTQQAKSVLQSNPRLGAVKDNMQEARALSKQAREALQAGDANYAANLSETAKDKAVGAVLEAYSIQ